MGPRTCRRPRPAEPPPFGPYGDKHNAANYFMRRNRSPRRPRPLVAPPAPSPVGTTSSCTSIVVASSKKTGVSSDMGFAGSEALYGGHGWCAPPEGRSQSSLGPGKDMGEDWRRSKRYVGRVPYVIRDTPYPLTPQSGVQTSPASFLPESRGTHFQARRSTMFPPTRGSSAD